MFVPTEGRTGMKPQHMCYVISWLRRTVPSLFPPYRPFCFTMRWQLSLLVTSKEPRIIDFIAMLQSCPPTRRARGGKVPMSRHELSDAQCTCMHTNKRAANRKGQFATVKLQWRMMKKKGAGLGTKNIFHLKIKHPPCEEVSFSMRQQKKMHQEGSISRFSLT